ncbi:MAG TPA: rhomboid family intramembrane serine protease [Kofleriaceae bacterium]|nr:rhomboid family intramembrane serine protease [Kofleriaceae bacterium]
MFYELYLVSIAVGGAYLGVLSVKQRPHGTATFGIMVLASAALAGLGLLGRRVDAPWLGIAGAIGVGAGTCLTVVGPVLRMLARRLVAAERMGLANRLLDLAEVLAPASGVAEEKAVLRAMTEIREGRIEQTIDALTAAKERAPADARLAIDERIAMLYLAAYRWGEAIAHAEAHLFGAPRPADGDGSLRRELGIAPPVWVELLGAYGRVGDLEQAARMVARLEDVCAGRTDASLWIHRARVMFLALAGRTDAVRALVAPRQARHMSIAARSYWMAVAHEHRGDRAAATEAYERARSRSRGRPRELIDGALAKLGEHAAPRPTALDCVATEVVARIEAAPLPAPVPVTRPRRPRATWALTALLLAVSATASIAFGEISDLGVLVRAGALTRGLLDAGEWWRLISCLFLHCGTVHLVVNAVVLMIVGWLAEELFGSVRVVALFAVAGIAGAVASYLATPGGTSVGASGAIFGLLGAVFLEITLHRSHYRAAWKQGLWGGLAIVTVCELGLGFVYPVIDQWAHGVGLAAGAALGFVLSPHARWQRIGTQLARALALAFGLLVVVAGVQVARTSLADSLTSGGRTRYIVDGIAIEAPVGWQRAPNQLFQPDTLVVVTLAHTPRVAPSQQIAMWLADDARWPKDELGPLETAHERRIAMPAGWQGEEREAAPTGALGYRQRLRVIRCGRAAGDQVLLMEIQVPDAVAGAAPAFFAALIASVGPA